MSSPSKAEDLLPLVQQLTPAERLKLAKYLEKLILEEDSEATTVHLLSGGFALCGKAGPPVQWEPGHKWVSAHDDGLGPRSAVNCQGCILYWGKRQIGPLAE